MAYELTARLSTASQLIQKMRAALNLSMKQCQDGLIQRRYVMGAVEPKVKNYILRIEELTKCPMKIISTGPGREHTFFR